MSGPVDRPIATASRSTFSHRPLGPEPSHFSFWSAKYSQKLGITATEIIRKKTMANEQMTDLVQFHSNAADERVGALFALVPLRLRRSLDLAHPHTLFSGGAIIDTCPEGLTTIGRS